MTEQVWANQLRFYHEDAEGTPGGDVLALPVGPAAASRRIEAWERRIDVFRRSQPATPIHEYHEGRMAFTPSLALLGFLLGFLAERTDGLDGQVLSNFKRSNWTPTATLEVETEDGDRFKFTGIAIGELQIVVEPKRPLQVEVQFYALKREVMAGSLTAVTGDDLGGGIHPAFQSTFAWAAGAWGADPKTDDAITTFAVQLLFSRQKLRPAMFNAAGTPTRYTSAPWRVSWDVRVPDGDLAQAAKTTAAGGFRLYLGSGSKDLQFHALNVRAYGESDPLKARDFRDESIIADTHPGSDGSLVEIIDNLNLSS